MTDLPREFGPQLIAVEILQVLIWSRSTDIDDVLTNALGGLLGAGAGFIVLRRTLPGIH